MTWEVIQFSLIHDYLANHIKVIIDLKNWNKEEIDKLTQVGPFRTIRFEFHGYEYKVQIKDWHHTGLEHGNNIDHIHIEGNVLNHVAFEHQVDDIIMNNVKEIIRLNG